jgi:hypothetical protein
MQVKNNLLLILVLVLISIQVDAQTKKSKQKSSTEKDVEIIDFDSDTDNKSTSKKEKTLYTYNHMIVKTNPFLPIFGKGLVELEREINDFLSVQVGLGVTFKRSYTGGDEDFAIFSSQDLMVYSESDLWVNDEPDDYNDLDFHKQKVGFIASIQPRLYFESEGFEGWYLAPVFTYSYNPYGARSVVETKNALIHGDDFDFKEKVQFTELSARLGAQGLYPKLTTEYFFGGGIRFENSTRQDVGRGTNLIYMNGTRTVKESRFFLEAGLRFGFQL